MWRVLEAGGSGCWWVRAAGLTGVGRSEKMAVGGLRCLPWVRGREVVGGAHDRVMGSHQSTV